MDIWISTPSPMPRRPPGGLPGLIALVSIAALIIARRLTCTARRHRS